MDAAVAVGFALAVTHPSAGNIGGGGFMLVRFADGRSTFIDFRERAPERASRNMYLDAAGKPTEDSVVGYRAAGVPGTVRGFEYASKKYGRKPWADLMAPAVALAAKGFPVSYGFAQIACTGRPNAWNASRNRSAFFCATASFTKPAKRSCSPSWRARCERIREQGARDFYEGETARLLAADMERHGGLITLADLKDYAVVERKPLTGSYRGYDIITSPPPSSGGVGILQMLGVLEGSGYEKSGAGSAAELHYLAETMRRYFADRATYMGDPDFVKVPMAGLLDPAYIAQLRQIDRSGACHAQLADSRGQAASGREQRDHALLDRGCGRQRGGRHLHAERRIRQRRDRARTRVSC